MKVTLHYYDGTKTTYFKVDTFPNDMNTYRNNFWEVKKGLLVNLNNVKKITWS